MSRKRRNNRWIALIALFGLLFQQAAMAAYVCPFEQSDTVIEQITAAAEHAPCHPQSDTDAADQARCEQHCHPVTASVDHAPPLTVPAVMLTEAWAVCELRLGAESDAAVLRPPIEPHATAPLTVQHCTFQI